MGVVEILRVFPRFQEAFVNFLINYGWFQKKSISIINLLLSPVNLETSRLDFQNKYTKMNFECKLSYYETTIYFF